MNNLEIVCRGFVGKCPNRNTIPIRSQAHLKIWCVYLQGGIFASRKNLFRNNLNSFYTGELLRLTDGY